MARRRKFPKLRWLLAGALAAGIWVVRQDAQTPRPPERVGAASTSVELPKTVPRPPRRPQPTTTSSIVRPKRPVGGALTTLSRVRMRAEASLSAAVLTTLEAGQTVRVLARSGKWRQVSASGKSGWVHNDYLGKEKPPRPRLPVAKPTPASATASLRPLRAPQGGDCQCPYDLMLDGDACGEHSAYVMRGASAARCYR